MDEKNYQIFKLTCRNIQLETDVVHVWHIVLNNFLPELEMLSGQLSPEEKKKADNFFFEKDKNRYIICRALLRTIIAAYLRLEPSRLQFNYGRFGKPVLTDNGSMKTLNFNISHSDNFALFAFARDREVGIDIEHIRDIPEMEQIVERFFSDREKTVFRALPENRKKEAFFQGWTRKEALLKALGDGLFQPLDRFDVSATPDEPTRPIKIEGIPGKASKWHIHDLRPASGYAAAYAVEGPSRLRWFHWPVLIHDRSVESEPFI